MPYLEAGIRASLEDGRKAMAPGELNYLISTELDQYITRKGLSYTHINEVMGVLSAVAHEFYRRVAVPYEQGKLIDNGEVFINAK